MLVNPRHAFGVDDIALANILARGQIVFFVWVTLTEHKWVILAERRGLGMGDLHWPVGGSPEPRSEPADWVARAAGDSRIPDPGRRHADSLGALCGHNLAISVRGG